MKAARLLAITLLLQARGRMTASELAEVLEVTPRTIYRDIVALGEARVPVVAESGAEGGYSLPEGYRVDPMLFSGEEAVALAMGGAVLRGLQGGAMGGSLQQALAKIEASLPPEYREDVRAGRERFLFDAAGWYAGVREPEVQLPALRAAVLHGRRVRLAYRGRAAAECESRDADPLGLVYKAGTWYLVAFCLSRDALRTFRVDRIAAVEQLAIPRAAYPDFDLARYWGESRARFEAHSRYPVRLRIDAALADPFLDRHLTILRREFLPDGALVVEVDLDSAGWAVDFVLGFGGRVTVLGPPEVVAEVVAAAERLLLAHRTSDVAGAWEEHVYVR